MKENEHLKNIYLLSGLFLVSFLIMGINPKAEAVSHWYLDFSNVDANSEPNTATGIAGEVHTKPAALTKANSTIQVKDSFSTASTSLDDKPVVVDGNGWAEIQFVGHIDDYEIGKDFCVEFDLLIDDNSPTNTGIFSVNFFRNGSGTLLGGLTLHTTDMKAILTSLDSVNPSEQDNFTNAWSVGTVMHVEMGLDAENDKLVVRIDDAYIGSIDLAPDPNYHGVRTIDFANGNGTKAVKWAVDNIYTSDNVGYRIGIPYFDVDFNDMDVNAAPATATASSGKMNTKPTSVSTGGGNSIEVRSSFTAGSDTLSNNPVVFTNTDGNNNPSLTFQGVGADYRVGKNFQLDFDMLISGDNLKSSANIFDVQLKRNGTSSPVAGFTLSTSNSSALLISSDFMNDTKNNTFNNVWNPNDLMHISLLYDGTSDRFDALIDDELIGSIELAQDTENQGVFGFYFSGSVASSTSIFAIDNIVTSIGDSDERAQWEVDFNDMDVNSAPSTATAVALMTNREPTSITTANSTIEVRSSYTTGTASLDKNPVVVDGNGWAKIQFAGHIDDYEVGKNYCVDFDLLIDDNTPAGTGIFSVNFYRNGSSTLLGGITLHTTNMKAILTSLDSTNPAEQASFTNVWSDANVMHVAMQLDTANDKLVAWIDDTLVGDINLAPDPEYHGVRTIEFANGNGIKDVKWAIDNIVSSVPDGNYQTFTFGNDNLELSFLTADDYFDLVSIENKSNGAVYAGWGDDPAPTMFRLCMRNSDGTVIKQLNNHSFCLERSYSITPTGNDIVLELNWLGFELAGDTNQVDVTVTVTAANTVNDGIEWDIDVDNRSTSYGLWEIYFPYIKYVPADGKLLNDYMAYPGGIGKLIPNPFGNQLHLTDYEAPTTVMGYPSSYNMQWAAIYDEDLGGLYFATHDPNAYRKDFFFIPGDDQYLWAVVHHMENKGQLGNDYNSPYSVLTQYTPGSWYDSTQIYRQWALSQTWTAAGTIEDRNDIPQWFKDNPYYFVTYGTAASVNDLTDIAIEYKDFFDCNDPTPLIWYNWQVFDPNFSSRDDEDGTCHTGQYMTPKANFIDAMAELEANNIHVQPYVNGRIFDVPDLSDPCFPEQWKDLAVKDKNGNYVAWSSTYPGLIDMCRNEPNYVAWVEDTCVELAEDYNTAGAYLDQFGKIHNDCFDPNHNHPHGGGDWQTIAMQNMAKQVRDVCKLVNSNAIFSGENCSEVVMGELEGNLLGIDYGRAYCPLQPAVYHDYCINYGRSFNLALNSDERFGFITGNLFVFGTKFGRFSVFTDMWLDDANYSDRMDLTKEMGKYKYAARKYLQCGQMLRPIEFDNEMPTRHHQITSDIVLYQPGVMSSVWEAPDETVGIVLFNITDDTTYDYEFTLTASDYPILEEALELYEMDANGTMTYIQDVNSSSLTIDSNLPAHGVRIYTLEPAS
ncbi:MAG: DUF6259 domain-containing protein [Planctomycetota bacterium]